MDIVESYRNWLPPVNVYRVVSRMVSSVSPKYMLGLDRIVLTNAGGLGHSRRRQKTWFRKKKTSVSKSRGLYHQACQGEPAWIEIFVDNIVAQMPQTLTKIPIIRDIIFAEVIFHEIGHHIGKTIIPTHREREDVADVWSNRLSSHYLRTKYWYIVPIATAYNLIKRVLKSLKKSA